MESQKASHRDVIITTKDLLVPEAVEICDEYSKALYSCGVPECESCYPEARRAFKEGFALGYFVAGGELRQ